MLANPTMPTCLALLLLTPAIAPAGEKPHPNELVEAARAGDIKRIKGLLSRGADVNAVAGFNFTPLWQAASKGHVEAVRLLLKHGAKTDRRDSVWRVTPLLMTDKLEIITMLTRAGARESARLLRDAARRGDIPRLKAILEARTIQIQWLSAARAQADAAGHAEAVKLLEKAADKEISTPPVIDKAILAQYSGRYVSTRLDELQVTVAAGSIAVKEPGSLLPVAFIPRTKESFDRGGTTLRFEKKGATVQIVETSLSGIRRFIRADARRGIAGRKTESGTWQRDRLNAATDTWPSFHGPGARGIARAQMLPEQFDVEKKQGLAWKTPVPGLANACPVVWKNRLFVATAVSSAGDNSLRIGIYGAGDSVKDASQHSWQVICLDARTGQPKWKRVAHEGKPPTKRHTKSSQANCTPATDGKHVVVLFPFGGLYCYSVSGDLLWKKQLGAFDSGAFNDPDYQWGFGSSPIIYRNLVVVQCDVQKDSFLAAFSVQTGEPIWRVKRDEVPSWGTPTVIETPDRPLLVANGTNFVRGYDVRNGNEIWRLGGNAAITVPTPFYAHGMIFVTSGYRPIQPIFAIQPNARGNITLKAGESTNKHIVWSTRRGGPYLPTPIVYGDYLYTCQNHGILSCYLARTGESVYRKRIGTSSESFTGSVVAADGRIYLTAESGNVHVIQAGPQFKKLNVSRLGEYCLTTPAISGGRMFFRTQAHIIAIGRKED